MGLLKDALIPLVAALFFSTDAFGAVWEVDAVDPPVCGRIGSVLDTTAPGDTLRIAEGRYLENLVIPHTVTILGAGSDLTVLEPCEGTGSILWVNGVDAVVVDGIGFENGAGSSEFPEYPILVGGGAAFLRSLGSVVRNCRFSDNVADYGGGVYVYDDLMILGCKFEGNRATWGAWAGGSLATQHGTTTVDDCRFEWGWRTGGLFVQSSLHFSMKNCVVLANTFEGSGSGIIWSQEIIIEDCTFWDEGAEASATAIEFPVIEDWPSNSLRIARTVFGATTRIPEPPIVASNRGALLDVDQITVVNRDIRISSNHGEPARFRNSILQSSRLALSGMEGSDGSCNVFWDVDTLGIIGFDMSTSRVVDPLLCDVSGGNLNVQMDSPCRPENSGGCGWIGASEGDCSVTPVLISGMDAALVDDAVVVSWEWVGVEPFVAWALVRRAQDRDVVVAEGQVRSLGREEIRDDRSGLESSRATYELRIQSEGGQWSALGSVDIDVPTGQDVTGLVLGPRVVTDMVSLALGAGTEARIVDVSGRLRATIQGSESGTVAWNLVGGRGTRLENGIYWVATSDRSDRFVVVARE